MSDKAKRTYEIVETVVHKEEIDVESCLDCGSDDVYEFDCGYSSFNITGARCNRCGRQIQINGDSTGRERIEEWNKWNSPNMSDARRVELLREQLKNANKKPLV